MIIITKYILKVNKNGKKCIISHETLPCPICGGHLTLKGFRSRKVVWSSGDIEFIVIRVLYCSDCSKSHRELPDFLLPYKHYTASIVEAVIDEKFGSCSAEESTIRRWLAWFANVNAYINAALSAVQSSFEKMRLTSLKPLDTLRKTGSGWLSGAMRRYINSGGDISVIT